MAYDVEEIFEQIELDLINNLTASLSDEDWRHLRYDAFQQYKARNAAIFKQYNVPEALRHQVQQVYMQAGLTEDNRIKMMKSKSGAVKAGTSFSLDDRKLDALIHNLTEDAMTAEISAFRMMDDVYKQCTVKAQMAMATNLYTKNQAIDIATKDFLQAGINSIIYSDGRRVNIVSYSEMVMRTGNRRAGLMGEGATRADWGEYLVYVTQYGACSDTCLPWQGRVFFDDVYAGGNPALAGKYPLLSVAIAAGLFHPNCRHDMSTWYEGISRLPQRMNEKETQEHSQLEEQQRYNERQIRKWKRLEEGALDEANRDKYQAKVYAWQERQKAFIRSHSGVLRRDYPRERAY